MSAGTCEKCGKSRPRLHRHHVKPRHLGGTLTDGKALLCANCHEDEHLELTPNQATRAAVRRAARERMIPREKLYQLYVEEGLSMREIAKLLGTALSNVQLWIKDYEIPIQRMGRKSVRPSKEQLVVDLKMLGSQTAVANKYGVTRPAVSVWCKRYGIEGLVDGRKTSPPAE